MVFLRKIKKNAQPIIKAGHFLLKYGFNYSNSPISGTSV